MTEGEEQKDKTSFIDTAKEKLTEIGDEIIDFYMEQKYDEDDEDAERPDIDPMLIPIILIIITVVLLGLMISMSDSDNSSKYDETNRRLDTLLKLRLAEMADVY